MEVKVRGSMFNRLVVANLYFILIVITGLLQRLTSNAEFQGNIGDAVISSQGNTYILICGISILTTVSLLVMDGKIFKIPQVMVFALLLNVLAIASFFWSGSPAATLRSSIGLFCTTIMAIYCLRFFSFISFSNHIYNFSFSFIWATFAFSLVFPDLAYHGSNEFYSVHAGLLKGFYFHKNFNGLILTAILVLIVFFPIGKKINPSKFLTILLTIFLIVQTGSAKSLVAVPIALLVPFLAQSIKIHHLKSFLSSSILFFIVFVFAFGLTPYLMEIISNSVGRDATMSGRTLIWESAIEYTWISGKWIFGGGYDAAWTSGIRDYSLYKIGFDVGHPHNGFIQLYIDLGLAGLSIILIICAIWAAPIFYLRNKFKNLGNVFMMQFSILLLVVFNNLGGTMLVEPFNIYWFLIVLTPCFSYWKLRDINTFKKL